MDLENIVVDITQRNYNTLQTIQYDVDSRYANVKIVNNGKNVDLTNYMVSIACKKPDGKIVFNETEMVEPKQGLIKFLISEQISSTLGEVVCELKIYGKNSSVLTTQYFTINVTKPIADKRIQSTNEFRQLTVAMNDYNAWVDKVKDKYDWLEEEYAEELTSVKSGLEETNAQLSQIESGVNFTELLIDNKISSIKLIGDSVTWGADADGWETIGHSGRLICDGKYEMSHELNCWANLFRRYVKKKNPNVDFLNAGISGYSMKNCSILRHDWIGNSTDCAFLILGINDGSQSESKNKFEEYTRTVISYMKENVKYPFVCSTSIQGEDVVSPVNNTTLNDRNNILKKVANELNVPFLDLNQEILKVSCDFGVTLKSGMFYDDELTHPSTLGHKMIWIALQRLLKIVDDPQTMVDGGYKNESYLVNELPTGFNLNTKPSETNFYNKNSHAFICVGNADIDGFGLPVERAGTVEIINPLKGTEGFVIQKFTTLYNAQYQRVFVNGIWTEWSGNSTSQDIDVSLQNGWVNSSSFTPSYLKIRGKQVELFLRVKDGSINSSGNVVVCSLPAEATPQKTFLVPVYELNGDDVTLKNRTCFISNDGNVYFNKFDSTGVYLIHTCYLI